MNSLVQPPAQSRDTPGLSPGCSELYPVGSSTPARMETARSLLAASSIACLSSWAKSFPLYAVWTSHFKLWPLSLVLLQCCVVKNLTLANLHTGAGGCTWVPREAASSPGWPSAVLQLLLTGQVPSPQPAWGSAGLTESANLLCTGVPQTGCSI